MDNTYQYLNQIVNSVNSPNTSNTPQGSNSVNTINGTSLLNIENNSIENEDRELCTICQEEIDPNANLYEPTNYTLKECGHTFHIE